MNTIALRHVASVIAGQSPSSGDVADLGSGLPFIQGNAEFGVDFPRPRYQCAVAPKVAEAGDVLLSVRAPVGATNLVRSPLGIGRGVAAVRLRDGDPRFLRYALQASTDRLRAVSTGTTFEAISADDLKSLPLPWVDEEGQRRVADFLDEEMSRIDEIVRLRREQITSLTASFQGRIRLAIGGAALSDNPVESGIPWIGEVHPYASVQPIRRCLTLQRGVDLTADERREGSYPVVTTAGVVGCHERALVVGPGVVIGRYGSVGNVFWLEGPYWPHNTTLYVKDFKGNVPRYVFWLLRAFPYEMQQARAAVPGVNRNDIHPVEVPYLPPALQHEAVRWIDSEEVRFESLVAEMTAQVGLLEERKRSMITAAVNGEFDVATASGRGV